MGKEKEETNGLLHWECCGKDAVYIYTVCGALLVKRISAFKTLTLGLYDVYR